MLNASVQSPDGMIGALHVVLPSRRMASNATAEHEATAIAVFRSRERRWHTRIHAPLYTTLRESPTLRLQVLGESEPRAVGVRCRRMEIVRPAG